jgi:hypothetical protein
MQRLFPTGIFPQIPLFTVGSRSKKRNWSFALLPSGRQSLQSILKKPIGRSSDNRALRNRAARMTSKAMSLAPAAVGLFPSYVMAIIRRPRLPILPLALRFARPLAQLAGLTSLPPPLGASALFRNAVETHNRCCLGKGRRNRSNRLSSDFSSEPYLANSLRCSLLEM